ncbi:cell division protein ZapA [Ectothiorhodospiraceae bacterium WFHF3C12]|nr:cell division protein ZapA [Ectothiorhodospiraceae bacterium WFHF3C12]
MAEPVKVQILDREFLVSCPEEERPGLLESASYLNERMREIRDGGKVVGMDRIAVMAALNITHELLRARNSADSLSEVRQRLEALDEKLAEAIDRNQ